MKTRTCPDCDLRFKSKPRRPLNGTPIVVCPRCHQLIEVRDA